MYPDTQPNKYSCEVTYKDGYYSIKELSHEDNGTESTMTYYRLTLDGNILQGDNVRYSDGSTVGEIAIIRADAFSDLAGSYTGTITTIYNEVLELDMVIQQAGDGTYQADCSIYPADDISGTYGEELCLVTYAYGSY